MKPRVRVHVDLPAVPDGDRAVLRKYGTSDRILRSSWRTLVWWTLYTHGGVRAHVVVRRHPKGAPRWEAKPGVLVPEVPWTALEAAWLGQLGAVAMLDAAARGRRRGRTAQRDLPLMPGRG